MMAALITVGATCVSCAVLALVACFGGSIKDRAAALHREYQDDISN